MIIAVSGYAGSGKDSIGEIVTSLHPDWEVKKWAGKLKQITSFLTGIPVGLLEDQDIKKMNLGSEWDDPITDEPMTIRDMLQKLGTEGFRNGIHTNVWINALMSDYRPAKLSQYRPSKWVITDTRFPNEAQAVVDRKGIVIRVNRPGFKPVNDHPSETALDGWSFDHVINNNGTLKELEEQVCEVLKAYMR